MILDALSSHTQRHRSDSKHTVSPLRLLPPSSLGHNCALKIVVNISKCDRAEVDSLRGGSNIFFYGMAAIVLAVGGLFVHQSLADSRAVKAQESDANELETNPAAVADRLPGTWRPNCEAAEEDEDKMKKKVAFPKVKPGVSTVVPRA